MSTEATVASDVVRSLNRRSGMIGSTATLASTYSAAAMTARPARTIATLVAEAHPNCWPARETHTSRMLTPPTMSVAPR